LFYNINKVLILFFCDTYTVLIVLSHFLITLTSLLHAMLLKGDFVMLPYKNKNKNYIFIHVLFSELTHNMWNKWDKKK